MIYHFLKRRLFFGLPQSPIVYSPYTNLGQIKPDEGLTYGLERKNQVLYSMYREKFIDKAQYEEAFKLRFKTRLLTSRNYH